MNAPLSPGAEENAPAMRHDDSTVFLANFLVQETGQRLSEARLWRLDVALQTLKARHDLATRADLVAAIRTDPQGRVAREAIDALLNHESSFFRDPQRFGMLENDVLPAIHRRKAATEQSLRIWCVGAAQGQEPYSLAMILKRMGALWEGWSILLLASDVSSIMVAAAQAGVFSQMDVQRGLPINELLRWFQPQAQGWVVHPELRGMIRFHAANLLNAPMAEEPFDLILCRNLLFYFGPGERATALRRLRQATAPEGFLMLGAGETVQNRRLFRPSATFPGVYVAADPPPPASA